MEEITELDLPRLQSFRMGSMSFEGDPEDERKIRTREPFLFKNTLIMKSASVFISMNEQISLP